MRIAEIKNYINLPPEMDVASVVVKLSDELNVKTTEEERYTLYKYVADLGGTTGLVLGKF